MTWTTGKINGAVARSGDGQYVSLPAGVVSSVSSCTIAVWVNLNAVNAWMRIFEFGSDKTRAGHVSHAQGRLWRVPLSYHYRRVRKEQRIGGTAALSTGVWTHVAFTWELERRYPLRQRRGGRTQPQHDAQS